VVVVLKEHKEQQVLEDQLAVVQVVVQELQAHKVQLEFKVQLAYKVEQERKEQQE
jgi:hypothetical protein